MARPKMSAWDKRGAYLAECFGVEPKFLSAAIDQAMESKKLGASVTSVLETSRPRKSIVRRKKSATAAPTV